MKSIPWADFHFAESESFDFNDAKPAEDTLFRAVGPLTLLSRFCLRYSGIEFPIPN